MKKLECLISVPDKYTKKEYVIGEIYEFEDERAEEILSARTKVTGEPYFQEYVEPIQEEPIEEIDLPELDIEEIEEKPKKKRKKKDNQDTNE